MSRRRASRFPAFVAARAVDAGLVRGTRGYVRFVVLGWYRTGSNLLLSLLNSDPAVVAYSELFSPRGLFWGNHTYAPRDPGGRLDARRHEDAAGFLADVVFRRYPSRVRAVGFKLFYPQLVVKPVAGLSDALRGHDGLRVVHLRRRNLLRVLVSNRVARRTGQASATSPEAAQAALERVLPLRLDPEECTRYFRQVEDRGRACDELFAGHPVHHMAYEDLAAAPGAEATRVRAFLGLPERESASPLVRQGTRPLSETVENLDAIRRHLAGTRWAGFADE